jgi:hypothetical protein
LPQRAAQFKDDDVTSDNNGENTLAPFCGKLFFLENISQNKTFHYSLFDGGYLHVYTLVQLFDFNEEIKLLAWGGNNG